VYDLAQPERDALKAARLADSELFKRLADADNIGSSACIKLTLCAEGQTPVSLLSSLKQARAADDRVRQRVRDLIG
jgi:hypothetical protein